MLNFTRRVNMSGKSIVYSILSVLLFAGLVVATVILFGINPILGIVGIVALLFIPAILTRKAKNAATGVLDNIIAKYIVPALDLVATVAVLLFMFLGNN